MEVVVSGSQVDKEVEKEVDKVDKNADKEVNPDTLPVPRRLPADRLLFPPGRGFLPFRATFSFFCHTPACRPISFGLDLYLRSRFTDNSALFYF